MIKRNSGIRGRTRTDEERQPKTEIITSRARDDSGNDNDIISTVNKNGIQERLGDNADQDEDLLLAQEVVNDIWCDKYKLFFKTL
jgi:hypothetical protein